MNLKDIHNKINFTPRLGTLAPAFSSVNNANLIGIKNVNDFNVDAYDKASLKIENFFINLLNSKKLKKNLIYVYDMNEKLCYEYGEPNYGEDWTGYEPNDLMVKSKILYTNISDDKKAISIKKGKYYIKEVEIEKFKNLINYGEVNFESYGDIMYLHPLYLHINTEIIIYGHMDYSFGFIDITGKNGELMKELLKDFVKIEGLTWYANELGKDYINNNKIDINLQKED